MCVNKKKRRKNGTYKRNRKRSVSDVTTFSIRVDREFMDSYRRILKRNKILYNKRKIIVEPVIGTIKSVLRFRRFALRGLEKVKSEWNLITTVYNLMKIRKIIIEGNKSFGY